MNREQEVKRAEAYLRAFKKGRLKEKADLVEALALKWFRINALYWIKDKDGRKVRFRANWAQRRRYLNAHKWDLILKARQLGFTTFEMLDSLDDCLFQSNFAAGCICHKLDDAKNIFDDKIDFAYRNIDPEWQAIFKRIGLRFPKPQTDRSGVYRFDNGSSITVSTSYRGGTLQRLHVSEFGKICKEFPNKAREIITGAFEAVGLGNQVTIESTAEGQEGYFYEFSQEAQKLQEMGRTPGPMDWNFHFFAWWEEPTYRLDPEGVVIPQRLREYFETLYHKHGIYTDAAQQAWYTKKCERLQDDMGREHPSTPEEAFQAAVEGAFYASQMTWLRQHGRISTHVEYNPSLPVHTAWDLGWDDSTAIWFFQVVGREIHIIDYFEDHNEGIEYFAGVLTDRGYRYGYHFGPHDIEVHELGPGKSRAETALEYGVKFETVPRVDSDAEGRHAVRQVLPMCWFAEEAAHQGVKCLDNFRREWDEKKGVYKEKYRHDWASHGAKAFETMARSSIFQMSDVAAPRPRRPRAGMKAYT